MPDDPPFDVQVEGNSASSVLVSWNPPLTPNGNIISYTLYINYTDGSPVVVMRTDSDSTSYTVIRLQPYQMVSVRVSASTAAGEGPAGDLAVGRARELGTEFYFAGQHAINNVYYCTDVFPPTISTFDDGTAVAGQTFTLFCRIVLPEGLVTVPMIEWISPEGEAMTSEGELTVGNQQVIGNPSRLTTYVAQFSPVLTSHAGIYTCQVTVTSAYGTIRESVATMHNVTVESECGRN